jgi:hypothetical protein
MATARASRGLPWRAISDQRVGHPANVGSKLIIDKPGAERLLGKGHLAELAGEDQIVLAQVPFASEEETLQLAAGGKFVGLAAE